MQIAQEMAGYSLGEADLLRRAMGKKIQAEMDKQRPLFLDGARRNGVDADKALEVWHLLDKFANYGFNKSHAAAYAVVSYQTAWLKANYPVEFMAGVMNCDIHLTEKLAIYKREVDRLGLAVVPPCVNRSRARFDVQDGALVYGLGALRNVGVDAMRMLARARGDTPFATLFDLARRVELKRIGKRALETLARAGAFDQLDRNRRRVFDSLDGLITYSAAVFEARASSQVSLFGEAGADIPEPRLAQVDDWLPTERLSGEHQAVGFYLSGHPLDDYAAALRRKQVLTLSEVQAQAAANGPMVARIAGAVSGRQERKSARGNRFAFVQLSDPTGLYEVTVFSDVLDTARQHLDAGQNVVLSVEATVEADTLKLLARGVQPIDAVVADAGATGLRIHVDTPDAVAAVAGLLARYGDGPARARGPLRLCVADPEQGREYDIDTGRTVAITPEIRGAVKSLGGVVLVEDL